MNSRFCQAAKKCDLNNEVTVLTVVAIRRGSTVVHHTFAHDLFSRICTTQETYIITAINIMFLTSSSIIVSRPRMVML